MAASIRIGTSGWIYKHWREVFYRRGLPQSRWFEHYAEHFDTVEVNFTFYRLPNRSVFESWNRRAPDSFIFAVKGSRYITHVKRLLDAEQSVKLFFERAEPLTSHLGPILWQLPPTFACDLDRLCRFLEVLPKTCDHALEFRDDSWFTATVYETLRASRVALCVADSKRRPAREIITTTDWTYIRFHEGRSGGSYTHSQLDDWARRLDQLRAGGISAWVYFNNDPQGHAVRNAIELRGRLGVGE